MATPRRHAVRFFVLLVGLCVLFMWPWPALEAAYGRLFARCGNRLIEAAGGDSGLLGTTGAAKLVADYEGDPQHDIQIGSLNFAKRGEKDWLSSKRTSSRHLGYMPAVTLIALVVASPIPWRRKLWALLWGLLLVHLFVVLRFGFVLLEAFHGGEAHCLFQFDPPWEGLFRLLFNVIAVVPATTYLVALVVWIAVSFRRDDLLALVGENKRT